MRTINLQWGVMQFNVDLPAKINIVIGFSATGKSYFVDILRRSTLMSGGYTFPSNQGDIDAISPTSNLVVVIDRADMLNLDTGQMLTDKNTYLLFGRHLGITGDVCYLDFQWKGTEVTGRADV